MSGDTPIVKLMDQLHEQLIRWGRYQALTETLHAAHQLVAASVIEHMPRLDQ